MATKRSLGWALAALVCLVLSAPSAQARGRHHHAKRPASGSAHREVTRTGPNGESRTRSADTTWRRGEGTWTRDTDRTGPRGARSSVHVDGSRTPDGFVRDKTTTGPHGATAITHDELQRTDGGFTRETTRTGPGGGVATRSATGSYDPASRTLTKDVTRVRPDGQTSSREVQLQKTEGGHTRDATVMGPNGRTASSHTVVQRTPGGIERDQTFTGPKGGVATRQSQGVWDPATRTWTRSSTTTGPNGRSATTDASTTFGPANAGTGEAQ